MVQVKNVLRWAAVLSTNWIHPIHPFMFESLIRNPASQNLMMWPQRNQKTPAFPFPSFGKPTNGFNSVTEAIEEINGIEYNSDRPVKTKKPPPPSIPPQDDKSSVFSTLNISTFDELLELSYQSAAQVAVLENKIRLLEDELTLKQLQVDNSVAEWSIQFDENRYESSRLQKEVELLQEQLPAVQNVLRQEQRRSEELQERLADMDYTLEYQQMEFNTEKTELLKQMNESKEQLNAFNSQWKKQEQEYLSKISSVENEIQKEQKRVNGAVQDMTKQNESFNLEKVQLEQKIELQRKKINEIEKDLENDRMAFSVSKDEMQSLLEEEKSRLMVAEQQLKDAEILFKKIEIELKEKLNAEQNKYQQSQTTLEEERLLFSNRQEILERLLLDEKENVNRLTQKLREERITAIEEKSNYQKEIENQKRILQLKKSQMKDRYDTIRNEMTTLWENTKRQGRQEISTLTKKYNSQIIDMSSSISQLENELLLAKDMTLSLEQLVQKVQNEKEIAKEEWLSSENKYIGKIGTLENEVVVLRNDLKDLRVALYTKEEEMNHLKTSVRQLLKESVSLTWKRVFNRNRRK